MLAGEIFPVERKFWGVPGNFEIKTGQGGKIPLQITRRTGRARSFKDFGDSIRTQNRSEVKICGRKKEKEKIRQKKEVVVS